MTGIGRQSGTKQAQYKGTHRIKPQQIPRSHATPPSSTTSTMAAMYPLFPILCLLSMICLLIPSAGHFRTGNSGTLVFIFWVFLLNLVSFVDTIVWHDNVRNPYPIWCDIASKIIYLGPIGLTCATLCITRKLWKVSRVSTAFNTGKEKRWDLIFDISVGLGFPALIGALHYIIQGHRYNLFEGYGCIPAVYTAYVSLPLYYIWPIVISLISSVYGTLALRQFMRRRRDLKELLSSTNTGISADRYIRLMVLSCIDITFGLPMGFYNLVEPLKNIRPWISWDDVHSNWSRIGFVREFLLDQDPRSKLNLNLSIAVYVVYGFIFFGLFAFGNEARSSYKDMYYAVLKPFGVKRPVQAHSIGQKAKRTLLDRILFRPGKVQISSVSASMPTFGSSISRQTQPTATFDWDMEEGKGKQLRVASKPPVLPRPITTSHDSSWYDDDDEKDRRSISMSSVSTKIARSPRAF